MGTVTAMLGVLVTVVALNPAENVVSDRVDLTEINHFYDEHGRLVFDQIIFYDWSAADSHYHVRAWRLLKTPSQLPSRDWATGDFSALWHDGDVLRKVRSEATRESWTQYDPELIEREFLPKEQRRELRKLMGIKPNPR